MIGVVVDINEAGSDGQAARVDFSSAGATHRADRGNRVTPNRHRAREGWPPGAVHDAGVADHQVVAGLFRRQARQAPPGQRHRSRPEKVTSVHTWQRNSRQARHA